MTVQELIDELTELDPDYMIVIDTSDEFWIETNNDDEEIILHPQD